MLLSRLILKAIKKIIVFVNILLIYKNPLIPILDRLNLLKNNNYLVKLWNGLMFKVRGNTSDIRITSEVFIHKDYQSVILNKKFKTGSVCVDIGANIGVFSVFLASKMRGGVIYSFEPLPENYLLLQKNINLNGFVNKVRVFQKAVSSKSGKFYLYRKSENDTGGGSIYFVNLVTHPIKIEIEAISIYDIFTNYGIEKIDFLKIDCEGCEYEIIYSIPQKYLLKIAEMLIEYHTLMQVDWLKKKEHLKNYLSSYNFEVYEFSTYIYAKQK